MRGFGSLLRSIRTRTLSVPVPLAPSVMVSQSKPVTTCAVHVHPAGAVTVILSSCRSSSTDTLVGLIEYVHDGVTAACDTVKVWPAIVSVPLRAGPVLAPTLNTTEPAPPPFAPEVMVMNETLLVALHGQFPPVDTETDAPVTPASGTD